MAHNRSHAVSLYILAIVFGILGIWGTYATTLKLTNDYNISLLASLFLGSSFFWITELHYPTVDLPSTALSICSFYLIMKLYANNTEAKLSNKLGLGILIGIAIAAKYSAALILLPLLILLKSQKTKDLILIIITAISIFALLMFDKMPQILNLSHLEFKTMFKAGYIGFENPAGHTLLYHLQTSLLNQYGLVLTVLALLGLISAKQYIRPTNSLIAFLSFPIAIYITMGLIKLEAPRYILPALPFIAILSALGLKSISNFITSKLKLHKSINMIVGTALVILTIYPNLVLAIKHDVLLTKQSTEDQYHLIIKELKNDYNQKIFNPILSLLPDGLRNINPNKRPTPLDCNSTTAIDFKKQFFNKPKNIVVIDSFWNDRYIYDWRFKCNKPRQAFDNYQDLHLFQINPFTTAKELVPFSHESRFSPKLPDIKFRKQHGPYFEILVADDQLANKLINTCKKYQIDCSKSKGGNSYYLSRIEGFIP